ncbi:MAG: hypothetical protein DME59_12490 [Verrucomicrobia bacterium]|nr:MAG: hypothetical protein DME59_12490 [Verrucomicrobiota bacterium]PYL76130.1 MAG: hypothetical protein DMF26_06860 [Verrucomicrobiota bacterium]
MFRPSAVVNTVEKRRSKEQDMKTKKKNSKVRKSAKTRLSDLTPKKDTRGGKYVADIGRTPPYKLPVASAVKRQYTL